MTPLAPEVADPDGRKRVRVLAAVIGLAALLAYANSLSVPFVYDDLLAITDNPTLKHLWPLWDVLWPKLEGGVTVIGRPVLNLSLAINHAISGSHVWSYHALNLAIHVGSALLLFGIVRRTARKTVLVPAEGMGGATSRFGPLADQLAGAVAVLWALHPLLTQAVTYTVQRAESLMGFFYLLTLYAFIRAAADDTSPASQRAWSCASVGACLLGVGTKEVTATAPLLVFLYDRTFVTGTFLAAWRERRRYYLALGATWLVLAALVIGTGGNRGGTVGVGVGISLWAYPLTQFHALARYLALSLWPQPLVFEYGTFWARRAADVLPYAVILIPLLAGTIFAIRRRPAIGFCGAVFFLILAPTSLAPGTIQMIVEHRMYLPLAALLALLAAGAFSMLGRRAWPVLMMAAAAGGLLTAARNRLYQSDVALWSDAIAHFPNNERAHFELGGVLLRRDRPAEAIEEFRRALQLDPSLYKAHNNLGVALSRVGRQEEALAEFEQAIRQYPLAVTHFAAAMAAGQLQQPARALAHYDAALRLNPRHVESLNNRASLRLQTGDAAGALADYEMALQLRPDQVEVHINAAIALLALGRRTEALAHCETAIRLQPDYPGGHWKAGDVMMELGRFAAAAEHYRAALRLDPRLAFTHYNLARALLQLGRTDEAIGELESAAQLAPAWAEPQYQLGLIRENAGQIERALAHYEVALRAQPNFPEAQARLRALQARRPGAAKP